MDQKPNIYGVPYQGLVAWFETQGGSPVHAQRVFQKLYQSPVFSLEDLKIEKKLKANFFGAYDFSQNTPHVLNSTDGSQKLLFKGRYESVRMPIKKRITVCVSSQSGCAMACDFCVTGKMGLKRSLKAHEIVEQVLEAWKLNPQEKITNVVFMGMGEPFMNKAAVIDAIDILSSDHGLKIAKRKITVSTVGVVPEIVEWANRGKTHLAISLIVANDEKRSKLMPINQKYPLKTLKEAVMYYGKKTNQEVLLEVILIEGLTDTKQDAKDLIDFVKGLNVKVNLIPYNENTSFTHKRPPTEKLFEFRDLLIKNKIFSTLRWSYGRDVSAACGQLAIDG